MGKSFAARIEGRIYRELRCARLKNKTPSIIASNCNGGIMLHDLHLPFNTPTINLFFTAEDYLKFVTDLDRYLDLEVEEAQSDQNYPVGKLGDITIYFMHYHSFREAKDKWNERKQRIDKTNLFFVMTDKNGCTYEMIRAFDTLPYEHKVIFTHKPYREFPSACYIPGFEEQGEVGILSDWNPGFLRRRYLDDFDYVSFLNGKRIKKDPH